jgi:hypothetical protein
MFMRNTSPVVSTLDSLLRQSLATLARGTSLDDDVRIRFNAVFDRIAGFYRAINDILCQCVVEQDGATIDVDRRPVRCPRLLVQCRQLDASVSRTLTFVYVPDRADRIALDILHANANYRTSQFFEWTFADGWCSDGRMELDAESHAAAVRRALFESDLFTPGSMELVPLAADAEMRR